MSGSDFFLMKTLFKALMYFFLFYVNVALLLVLHTKLLCSLPFMEFFFYLKDRGHTNDWTTAQSCFYSLCTYPTNMHVYALQMLLPLLSDVLVGPKYKIYSTNLSSDNLCLTTDILIIDQTWELRQSSHFYMYTF